LTRALPNPDSLARDRAPPPEATGAEAVRSSVYDARGVEADTIDAEPVFDREQARARARRAADEEPSVGEIRGSGVGDRLSGLINASGWIVILVDDFHSFREWERLQEKIDARTGDGAQLRQEARPLLESVHVEILPILAWAVRTRPDDPDEIVPLVPWNSRVGPPDDIVAERHMLRMTSLSFLDEDERRLLTRDGIVRRKLEWYADKVQR
jgi:hypothetical protein